MLELFPDSAAIEDGELRIARHARRRARGALRDAARRLLRGHAAGAGAGGSAASVPEASIVYGTKAFPNVALLRLFAEEGLGADVASAGELAFALAAGLDGARIVMHGNAKSDDELRAASAAGATVALDAEGEAERATAAGVRRVLVRVTLGVEADTHEAIRTGHHGSKFGLPPDGCAPVARERSRAGPRGVRAAYPRRIPARESRRARGDDRAPRCVRCTLSRRARVDARGRERGRRLRRAPHPRRAARAARRARALGVAAVEREWQRHELPRPRVTLEPGRALVGQAAVTLYRVLTVKRLDGVTWVAVDGGMSDNPRPQLYGARYTALSAARANEPATETVSVAGLHCESGDVLIDDVMLPPPRPGDLLAIPVTGAYALAMSSNYNATPRPAAVLARDGEARVIRRRETIDDLLAFETEDRD